MIEQTNRGEVATLKNLFLLEGKPKFETVGSIVDIDVVYIDESTRDYFERSAGASGRVSGSGWTVRASYNESASKLIRTHNEGVLINMIVKATVAIPPADKMTFSKTVADTIKPTDLRSYDAMSGRLGNAIVTGIAVERRFAVMLHFSLEQKEAKRAMAAKFSAKGSNFSAAAHLRNVTELSQSTHRFSVAIDASDEEASTEFVNQLKHFQGSLDGSNFSMLVDALEKIQGLLTKPDPTAGGTVNFVEVRQLAGLAGIPLSGNELSNYTALHLEVAKASRLIERANTLLYIPARAADAYVEVLSNDSNKVIGEGSYMNGKDSSRLKSAVAKLRGLVLTLRQKSLSQVALTPLREAMSRVEDAIDAVLRDSSSKDVSVNVRLSPGIYNAEIPRSISDSKQPAWAGAAATAELTILPLSSPNLVKLPEVLHLGQYIVKYDIDTVDAAGNPAAKPAVMPSAAGRLDYANIWGRYKGLAIRGVKLVTPRAGTYKYAIGRHPHAQYREGLIIKKTSGNDPGPLAIAHWVSDGLADKNHLGGMVAFEPSIEGSVTLDALLNFLHPSAPSSEEFRSARPNQWSL